MGGVVAAAVALLGVVFSTVWAAGGWRGVVLRLIEREIALSKSLPDGSEAAELMMRRAERRAKLYALAESKTPSTSQLLGRLVLAAAMYVVLAIAMRQSETVERWTEGEAVSVTIVVVGFLLFLASYALVVQSVLFRVRRKTDQKLLRGDNQDTTFEG